MGDIEKIFTIDYQGLIVNVFIIIFAIVATATIMKKSRSSSLCNTSLNFFFINFVNNFYNFKKY